MLVPVAAAMSTIWLPGRWSAIAAMSAGATYAIALGVRGIDAAAPRWIVVFGLTVLLMAEMGWVLDRVHTLAEQERLAVRRGGSPRHRGAHRPAGAGGAQPLARGPGGGAGPADRPPRRAAPVPVAAGGRCGAGGGARRPATRSPHRRRIAVVFCDLRGFTAFTNTARPTTCSRCSTPSTPWSVRRCTATGPRSGPFQGDGVMAYFNDPVPCDEPAATAVTMLVELRARSTSLLPVGATAASTSATAGDRLRVRHARRGRLRGTQRLHPARQRREHRGRLATRPAGARSSSTVGPATPSTTRPRPRSACSSSRASSARRGLPDPPVTSLRVTPT